MPLPVPRGIRALVVTVILAFTLTGLDPASPVGAMPIEGYPTYQPQSKCSPRPKPGTVMLEEHLLKKYKGSGSSGISRSCSASGVSEHKEGRAFDWRLDATSKRDRCYARDFLSRILATDKAGNERALARRMGIMYVIWNDHIWSASKSYRKRDYLHPACKKVSTCSTTLRHRDHMHISLTWAGARAKTSWYIRRLAPKPTPAPAPAPAPTPDKPTNRPKPRAALPEGVLDLREKPYTTIHVPANGETVETRFKLHEGWTYSLTAAGLYTFGSPNQVGDAACTWSKKEDAWVPKPSRRLKRKYGRLALFVNGSMPFGGTCRASHTYRTEITPTKDRPLRLTVVGRHPSSSGRLTVVVGRKRARVSDALPTYPTLAPAPAPATKAPKGFGLLAETVTVPASATGGSYTIGSLSPAATYRLTVSGVVRLGGGVLSNGQCLSVAGTWYRSASIDRRVPDADHGNLYVNGVPFSGRAASSDGCSTNSHTEDFTPDARGRLRLDLWDPLDRSDNGGELQVKVQRVTPIATPTAPPGERPRVRRTEWQRSRDWFEVDPKDRDGTLSSIKLRKGVPAQIVIRGRFTTGGRQADASCVKLTAGWEQADPDVLGQDPLNVWVDDQPVAWRALGPTGGCSEEYRYTTTFTPAKSGPIRVSVFDLDYRDNKGSFEVTVLREV